MNMNKITQMEWNIFSGVINKICNMMIYGHRHVQTTNWYKSVVLKKNEHDIAYNNRIILKINNICIDCILVNLYKSIISQCLSDSPTKPWYTLYMAVHHSMIRTLDAHTCGSWLYHQRAWTMSRVGGWGKTTWDRRVSFPVCFSMPAGGNQIYRGK